MLLYLVDWEKETIKAQSYVIKADLASAVEQEAAAEESDAYEQPPANGERASACNDWARTVHQLSILKAL